MQAMADQMVSGKFESVDFEISLCQTLENLVWSPRYLVKGPEALLDTDTFLEPVSHVVKSEADNVIDITWKREERIKKYSPGRREGDICPFVNAK